MNCHSPQAAPMSSEDAAQVLKVLAMGTSNTAEGIRHGGCTMDAPNWVELKAHIHANLNMDDSTAWEALMSNVLDALVSLPSEQCRFRAIELQALAVQMMSSSRSQHLYHAMVPLVGVLRVVEPPQHGPSHPLRSFAFVPISPMTKPSHRSPNYSNQSIESLREKIVAKVKEMEGQNELSSLMSPDYSSQSIESLSDMMLANAEEMGEQKEPPSLMSPDYSNQSIESLSEKILAKVEDMGEQKQPSPRGKVLSFSTCSNVKETRVASSWDEVVEATMQKDPVSPMIAFPKPEGSNSCRNGQMTQAVSKKQIKSTLDGAWSSLDVLAGRGGASNNHHGNALFRDEARKLRGAYRKAERHNKMRISRELVQRVKSYGGRFLKKEDDGVWFEMNDKDAYKKASAALREGKW